jgi:amidophosphoribosyltransferase
MLQQLGKLTHRGSDGTGVALEKKEGTVVFKQVDYSEYPNCTISSKMGIGHVRYRTKGTVDNDSCQPLMYENIALVHNGHIDSSDYTPDSYLLLTYFQRYPERTVLQIVSDIHREVLGGSYSCIVMIPDYGLVAFRDPRGIRPLVYHRNKDRVIIASESCVISKNAIDVEPGECVIFQKDGTTINKFCTDLINYTPCIFEYIYFSHKNSTINGIHVYKARQLLGNLLAQRILKENYDMVVPVPKTSCVSALEISRILNIPYQEILTVRRGRSFILPRQTIRESLIQEKFHIDEQQCKGKNILLVDDSIVRGTTMRSLNKRLREAGVNKITVASCAPPVRSPNIYGIDITSKEELVINQGPENEVAQRLGADRVIYQDLDTMVDALHNLNRDLDGFECSMFLR